MKILLFAASFRRDSLNKKLIRNAARMMPAGHDLILKEFEEYMMPLYHGDLEANSGIPDAAQKFIQDIAAVDALVISSPEYNAGIPGTLKNAIDWTSRVKPVPWVGKQILLMGASPGMIGTNRGLWQVRQPLEYLGGFVFPEMLGVALADKAFDEKDLLKEPRMHDSLQKLLIKFADYANHASQRPSLESSPNQKRAPRVSGAGHNP